MSDPNTNPPAADEQVAQNVHTAQPAEPLPQSPGGAQDAAPSIAVPQAMAPSTAAPQVAAEAPAQPRKLSTFLKVSIILLAGLTVASISLLFIGDFEGKFERVFSTFALFAVFVLFTALDTRRGQKSEWYAPVALIANSYILALLLIVIWMTAYDSFTLMLDIIWKSLLVIAVTRLAILCCQLLLRDSERQPAAVTRFAFVTSVLTVLSAILFTAPVGIEAFDLYIPDLYWRIATAILILTALGLSITLLLRWFYGSERREAARAAAREQYQAYAASSQTGDLGQGAQPYYPLGMAVPAAAQQQNPEPSQVQAHQESQQAQPQSAAQPQAAVQPQAGAPTQAAQPQPAGQQVPAEGLLPWPTFPDGSPLPAGPDGQPDFSVLQQPR